MLLGYSGGFAETVAEIAEHERAGLGVVWVPEAYSFDAVRAEVAAWEKVSRGTDFDHAGV